MKKTLVIAILVISTIISGCSKLSINSELENAKNELENHNYDKAINILSEVINDDPNNSEARAMYMQGIKMASALKYEEKGYYDKAIEELNYIVNINNGSNAIKRESTNWKTELEKLQKENEEKFLKAKENAKQSSKKYNQNAEYKLLLEEEKRKQEEEKNQEYENLNNNNENEENESLPNSNEIIEENEANISNEINNYILEKLEGNTPK